MLPQKYLNLLDELDTDSQQHSLGTLREHLLGTYQLLIEWGNPEYLALGGLFHSIYGTQKFSVQSISLDQRPYVARIIGEEAENLAYLFGVTERQGFLYEAGKQEPRLWNFIDHQLIPTTLKTIKDLIEIEVANAVDQQALCVAANPQMIAHCQHVLARGAYYMSSDARTALAQMIEETQV
ncbi:MAG: hypothetical protein F6J87_10905 [Spirulina sp. SIO3F2]|nr:hypothetical protein [Spirulina sp. SIO3F2]